MNKPLLIPGCDLWLTTPAFRDADMEVEEKTSHLIYMGPVQSFNEVSEGVIANFTAWMCMDDTGLLLPINPLTDCLFLIDPSLETANIKP